MDVFIGRHHELEGARKLPAHKANIVVLKGRRRVGKIRLAAEFACDIYS